MARSRLLANRAVHAEDQDLELRDDDAHDKAAARGLGQVRRQLSEKVFSPLRFPEVRNRILAAVRTPRVLDMGCGPTPFLLRELLKFPGIDLYASDYSQRMLDATRRHFPEWAIQFVHADHLSLPFPDEFFDTIVSVNSILPETREDVVPIFAEAFRVLKTGGRFVALLAAFETSLMARDRWGMVIGIDEANHREYDTTGWQCFYTRADVEALMSQFGQSRYQLEQIHFDSPEAIAEIKHIYGNQLDSQALHDYPLFEHFLVVDKTAQPPTGKGSSL